MKFRFKVSTGHLSALLKPHTKSIKLVAWIKPQQAKSWAFQSLIKQPKTFYCNLNLSRLLTKHPAKRILISASTIGTDSTL